MIKRKVLIVIHQLNIGGAQKALISALNAIDYTENDVILYVRKNRLDLLPFVNKNVSKIIVNNDNNKYYRKPYSAFLLLKLNLLKALGKDTSNIQKKLNKYIIDLQMKYEREHYFSENIKYDIVVSYIQNHTAKFVAENIDAKRKIMFYHNSTDGYHEINADAMKYYEKIYSVSKCALEAVSKFYPEFSDKMDYIENYVDFKAIRNKAEECNPDYPKNKLILCTCGRITPEKGYDLAVETAEILKENNIDFKWYFVGDGSERAKIEELIASKKLNDNIVITGLKENPYPYMKKCDIYVQPSYEEAHPLSIIEAQMLCKVVVSTATAGGKSIITDEKNGIIAEINPESLAEKIQYILENKELRDTIRKNLCKKDYSNIYQVFCEKWKEVLNNKN